MGKFRLPEGVPEDNGAAMLSVAGRQGGGAFRAPDTATPAFAAAPSRPDSSFARVIIETEDEEETGEDEETEERNSLLHGPHAPMLILVAVGAVLIVVAAFALSPKENAGLPDCAAQPEWNQYNCRTN